MSLLLSSWRSLATRDSGDLRFFLGEGLSLEISDDVRSAGSDAARRVQIILAWPGKKKRRDLIRANLSDGNEMV